MLADEKTGHFEIENMGFVMAHGGGTSISGSSPYRRGYFITVENRYMWSH